MNNINYLQSRLEDLEEKLSFHDCTSSRHCGICGDLYKQINDTRKSLAEAESLTDDSHELLEQDL